MNFGKKVAPAAVMAAAPKPAAPKLAGAQDLEITQGEGFNLGVVLIWAAAAVALTSLFLFWFANHNVAAALAAKSKEKDSVIQQITSPTYAKVEKQASDLKAAVTQLRAVSSGQFTMGEFLPLFYKHITNDVKLSSLSVTNGNSISIQGATSSYRSVADLMLALKSWSVIKDVNLGSVSLAVTNVGKTEASFSMTIVIDTSVPLKEATTKSTSNSSATSSSTSSDVTDSSGTSVDSSSSANSSSNGSGSGSSSSSYDTGENSSSSSSNSSDIPVPGVQENSSSSSSNARAGI